MANPACSDDEFIRLFKELGSPTLIAKHIGVNVRNVTQRRVNLERKYGIKIDVRSLNPAYSVKVSHHKARIDISLENAVALAFSDNHYWPGIVTTAHKAVVRFAKELQPDFLFELGDAFDGARASRWPRIGWDSTPTLKDELFACQERMTEIEDAAPKAKKFWTLGNHDGRFETKLAQSSPEYEGIHGFSLKDHFPDWMPCWRVDINEGQQDHTILKHRWKGGEHSTHNNVKGAWTHFAHGHDHSGKITWYTSARGTFYGMNCGTLAEPDEVQFVNYTEDNPKNWRSSFCVLTYHKGRLMQPELVEVMEEGVVWFRGQRIVV